MLGQKGKKIHYTPLQFFNRFNSIKPLCQISNKCLEICCFPCPLRMPTRGAGLPRVAPHPGTSMTVLVPAPAEMGWIVTCKTTCGGMEWGWSGSDISLVDLASLRPWVTPHQLHSRPRGMQAGPGAMSIFWDRRWNVSDAWLCEGFSRKARWGLRQASGHNFCVSLSSKHLKCLIHFERVFF